MSPRVLVALVASAVLLLPIAAAQAGAPDDRATGGGQVLLGSSGAGNTIAFTAQNVESAGTAARGQVQFVDRSAGPGQEQVKFHGIVTCLRVSGTMAELAGFERNTGEPFNLRVVDNGEGAGATGMDMIEFNDDVGDASCDDDDSDDEEPELRLARGNAQVYDNGQ